MPETDLLPAPELGVLLSPGSWRLVSTLAAPDRGGPAKPGGRPGLPAKQELHRYPEILIQLRGQAVFGLADRAHHAGPGTVFLARASEKHWTLYPRRTSESMHLCVNVPGDFLTAQVVRHTGDKAQRLPSPPLALTSAELGLNLRQQFAALDDEAPPAKLRRARFLALAALLAAAVAEKARQPAGGEDELARLQGKVIDAVKSHLHETAGAGVTLDSLAHFSGYSKYHLLRMFKRLTGQTIHEYLDYCRLGRARELSAQGRSRKEIAAVLGFSGPQAFSRWSRGRRLRIP